MSEENKNNPSLDFKDIGLFKSIKLTLDCAKPIKTGESTFGTWNLWIGIVEDMKVWEGRGKDKKPIENYSGKVVFFPTEKTNEQLVAAADGNTGVEVQITKEAEEGPKGLIKRYVVKKLGEGHPSQATMTPGEIKLINDLGELSQAGIDVTESDTIAASTEEKYGGQITEERAKKLYIMFKSM